MMIHEKLMSGQFLLDFKNERTNLLHGAVTHQRTHSATRHQQDIYSAYACQQRQLIGSSSSDVDQHRQPLFGVAAEVLDLSRRYESVETSRKTPSPYQTSSSLGTNSPNVSPTSSEQHQRQQFIPTNLLYAAQPVRQLPPPLASLYPALYYAGNVKQEPVTTSTSSPPPPMALCPASPQQLSPVPSQFSAVAASNNLLQSFGPTASIVSAATLPDIAFAPLSPAGSKSPIAPASVVTTPTSSISVATALTNTETKSTRPFKAFPRDPLVIAANFAAADVLLDNPRVERYTEYRKRVLEQIRSSNGGTRTVTNPKMRRTNSINVSVSNGASSTHNSENEERHEDAEDLSDCDSNTGNCEKMSTSITSTSSSASINATKSRCSDNNANTTTTASASSITNTNSGGQIRDAAYYERRRKNNAAAKKSRDRRRIKEDEIAIRAAYLERQNIELLCQIDALKAQLATFTSKIGA